MTRYDDFANIGFGTVAAVGELVDEVDDRVDDLEAAQTAISGLPDAGTLTGTELVVLDQDGVTVKETLADVRAYGALTAGRQITLTSNVIRTAAGIQQLVHTSTGNAGFGSASVGPASLLTTPFTYAAGLVKANDWIIVEANGTLTNNTGGDRTFTISVQVDPDDQTAVNLASASVVVPSRAAARGWRLRVLGNESGPTFGIFGNPLVLEVVGIEPPVPAVVVAGRTMTAAGVLDIRGQISGTANAALDIDLVGALVWHLPMNAT